MYGEAQSGALLQRISAIESSVLAGPQFGTLPDRVKELEVQLGMVEAMEVGDAAVVEISAGGTCVITGCLETANHHLLVIDPRKVHLLWHTWNKMDGFLGEEEQPDPLYEQKLKALLAPPARLQHDKLRVFMLLPSTTSSPYSLLHAEIGLSNLSGALGELLDPSQNLPVDWLRFIRLDDWAVHGHDILTAMMAKDMIAYPAEEVDAMRDMVCGQEELRPGLWPEPTMAVTLDMNRINTSVYRFRAWVHFVVGAGADENDIQPGWGRVADLLEQARKEGRILPTLADLGMDTHTAAAQCIQERNRTPLLLTFSASTTQQVQDGFKLHCRECTTKDQASECLERHFDPILVLDEADWQVLPGTTGVYEQEYLPVSFLCQHRDRFPYGTLGVVLLAASMDSFKTNLWLVPLLHQLIENTDWVILAVHDEVEQLGTFFSQV